MRLPEFASSPPPWAVRATSWGISIGSLALGLTTLFVFRRGLPRVSLIIGYLLLVGVLITIVAELRVPLDDRRRRLMVGAAEYLLQTLCHGLFLFVLPSYYAATTISSPNVVLLALLIVAAMLTTIDPWYRTVVHSRPWLRAALLGLALFVGLNVALALFGVREHVAALGAAAVAGLALTPAVRRPGSVGWAAALTRSATTAALACAVVLLYPVVIPPAPMFTARGVIARDVVGLEPVEPIHDAIDAATVRRWGALAAYTAVYAPGGMQEPIEHVWYRDGVDIARIPLPAVRGGRQDGFRTFSRHRVAEPLAGRYHVDVMTTSGQLVGRVHFTIVP